MTPEEKAEKIIDSLKGRGGFDGWWDGLDAELQAEITTDISNIVAQTE